ncbi:restriction endonuclease [Salmonella enterica subsp. enterica serovar Enteritidis]|nr:hypothetical protein [Salmonella enterica subsp. enterica serovar Newport]ECM0314358.1 restriction endonuclease [Salmonella enterica subsp. enterica serovar Enteritidis]EIT8734102.1 restriction endonuclease [Salmonella enterica]ELO2233300.1 restriction endonuclease [Salmonella enterica]ELU9116134.1 restriction endonuclease [Salmonella enterica]
MKGIGTVLQAGYLKLDHSMKTYSVLTENTLLFTGHFADLDPHGWGSLCEKFTGQAFEAEGYEVEYRGLTAGFNDGGIDLILRKENDTIFVQCKHAFKSSLSCNSIENILYKAGNYISRNMPTNRVHLWLVVPDVKSIKWKRYFLRHNTTQNKVKLSFVEIRMLSI